MIVQVWEEVSHCLQVCPKNQLREPVQNWVHWGVRDSKKWLWSLNNMLLYFLTLFLPMLINQLVLDILYCFCVQAAFS